MRWYFSLLIIIQLFLICVNITLSKCPSGCTCDDNDHKLKCRFPAARAIPQYIFPRNITSLDLSDNNILNIPPGCLRSITKLEEINMDNNKIYFIENGAFKGAKQLRKISLEDNNIHFIENDVFSILPNLEELKLNKNQLTTFPNVQNNPHLSILSLSYNNINMIPNKALEENNELRELHLESNQISDLPRSIFPAEVSNFTVLNLVKNRLHDTPKVVGEMVNLETLNLCYNPIKIFRSDDFRQLSSLKTLTLTDVGLSTFPGNILWFPMLEYLDIAKNEISGTGLSSIRFKKLKTLKLSGNPIDAIGGNAFRGIPEVENIFASSCGITGIDDEAFSSLSRLKKLELQNNKLSTLPKFSKNFNLEEINVNNNKIFALAPLTLSSLRSLKKLSMANNSLSEISASAFGSRYAAALSSIDISGNKFTNIPPILAEKVTNLTSLNISRNLLSDEFKFSSISEMKNLKELNVKKNQINELLPDISLDLPSLKRLYMCDNNLTRVENGTLKRFPNLEEFTANRNKIEQLNKNVFTDNKALKKLWLNGNGLLTVDEDTFKPLNELTDLMLLFNKLTSIPKLTSNHKLTRFGFCNNPVGDLPAEALTGPKALEIVLLRSIGTTSLDSKVFGNVKAIKYLNLALDNKLTNVPPLVRNMTSLRVIKLTGNPIEHLSARDFEGLNNLREIRIDNMKLTSMDVTELFPALPAIRTLHLSGNPWMCDCNMQWYSLGIDGHRARVTTEDRSKLKCAGPGRLNGKSFDYLRLGDFGQCIESKVVEVDETSVVVSLPSLNAVGRQGSNVFHKVSYVPLIGDHEEIVTIVQRSHKEIRLSTLIPDTSYVVCVSAVVPLKLRHNSGNQNEEPIKRRINSQINEESCQRFRTKEPKVKTPWSNGAKAGLDESPKYLIIVIAGLAGAIAITLVATVISVAVWCRKIKANAQGEFHAFDDTIDAENHENETSKAKSKVKSREKSGNGKTKRQANETADRDQNGEALEMTCGTNSGNENHAFNSSEVAQRTKL
uniref:protein artichoke-like n=1 Tax=Styela clava TaxID=7725 RepID=UPI001939487D|nr:protein artichoke-like [Styela clava]